MIKRNEDRPLLIQHPHAEVRLHSEGARWRVIVEPRVPLFIHTSTCSTAYPPELIEHVLAVKGPGYLCDEIRRDEDPAYVQSFVKWVDRVVAAITVAKPGTYMQVEIPDR